MSPPLDLQIRIGSSRDDVGFTRQPQDAMLPRALRRGASSLFLLFPLLNIFLISCGGLVPSDPPAPPSVVVTVLPASAKPFAGTTVQFTATVQNAGSPAVNWQVNGMTNGDITTVGSISVSGLYTAPNSVPTPQATVKVAAVLRSDPAKTGSSSVTIQPLSAFQGQLSLSPKLSSVTTSQTLQLDVTSDGFSNNQVNWAVDGVPNGNNTTGKITSGLYTPPNSAGSHTIAVTLIANPSASGSARVVVTDLAGMFTWRNDNSRTGQNQKEFALTPATVTSSTFGRLFSCLLDGNAYAQPLYVANLAIPGSGIHNVVIVATEKDSVFAFDADANANPCVPLWQTSLIPAGEQVVPTPELVGITSKDVVPFIGITGTPVIDLSSSTLYVVAETQTTTINPGYIELLYALDLATGHVKILPTGLVAVTGVAAGAPFSSLLANQRAALLLDNGNIYVALGSHGGQGDYHGWLFGYDASTLQQHQNMVFDVTPTGIQGGIWQSGGGPSADSNHNVFVATGNGTFDANPGANDYGDSYLRLNLNTGGVLSVADYFTPCDQATMFTTGQDLGSSAPVLLPDSAGSASQPHLMMGGAMNGSLYVLNRDSLGGYVSACPDSTARVQVVPVGDASVLSTPLFWNNFIYVAAGNGRLKAFPMDGGAVNPAPLPSQSPEPLGPQGATPVVSWNGTNTNNAIIWLIDTSGALTTPPNPNTPAILRAFDAGNLSHEIYNSAMVPNRDTAGLAVKFTVPTVANGKVYVGTQTELDVYGLLP
jgi:hypothetical protein